MDQRSKGFGQILSSASHKTEIKVLTGLGSDLEALWRKSSSGILKIVVRTQVLLMVSFNNKISNLCHTWPLPVFSFCYVPLPLAEENSLLLKALVFRLGPLDIPE